LADDQYDDLGEGRRGKYRSLSANHDTTIVGESQSLKTGINIFINAKSGQKATLMISYWEDSEIL
jgi:hypothetical protein